MNPIECPRCESPQKFARRTRSTDRGYDEAFIRCKICGWEYVLEQTTKEIEHLYRERFKAGRKIAGQQNKYGRASQSTMTILANIQSRLHQLKAELSRKVELSGTTSN